VIGTLVLVLVVIGSLQFDRLRGLFGGGDSLRVEFAEAGGLTSGDDVVVSGAKVGSVHGIKIEHGRVLVDLALDDDAIRLGRDTRAKIVTVTLLGRAAVELDPRGDGRLADDARIPVSRTSSPYDITSALSELTTKATSIDKAQLARAFDQVSETFADTPDDVGQALSGIDRVAAAVADNDGELRSLLARASRVSGVLADRDAQISTLLTSGSDLLGVLESRQDVVVSVLRSGQSLAAQLRAALDENDGALGPALDELDQLLGTLNRNRDNLQQAITGLRNYATAFGEAISSGPFFDAYVQNLTAPASLAPILSGMVP
jgi:phospholipid/cholesterol/gamma-HCH transport system substrate-binding protein